MKTTKLLLGICMFGFTQFACKGDDGGSMDDSDETAGPGDTGPGDTGPGDTGPGDTGPTGTSTGDSDGSTGGSSGEDPFVFDPSPPDDYSQVDRMGMPGVNTAVITSKDDYNADNPAGDSAGKYVSEITANLTALHEALDDDLTGLSVVPCAVDDCIAQAAPLVVPDTIKLDLTMPAGFPNGRGLEDPVMDVTLAVVLLDLSEMGQDATTFANVPVNPPANDVAFSTSFPYLAAPN